MAQQRMVLEVIHLDHANVSKMELKERLAKMYKVKDRNTIFVFKFRAGSTGSGLIYDNLDSKKFEPKYCLIWVCCRLALPFVACRYNVLILG
ncbi:40S ribosomal protein S24-1 [Zea mays]|uniref:40S ribosomal protein S24-1 n=1 Tax=Zea mays TaxID=4577 RepID=A0A1D6NB02_MAIZE|nr:40S ribosomal protein S24-1 [Zea mays]